ncbi:MAG: hypothetical protein LWY06_07995 [Firmicutes bacterium]|nr:hypothetical protein [Bacillota bacterium]
MREVTNKVIKVLTAKFSELRELNPELMNEVNEDELRKVVDYLLEPGYCEQLAFEQLIKVNFYSYTIFIHEKTEIAFLDELVTMNKLKHINDGYEKRENKNSRTYWEEAHKFALFEQYKVLQNYINSIKKIRYPLTKLCYCDGWDGKGIDPKNAKRLKQFIDKNIELWYNQEERAFWGFEKEVKQLISFIRSIRNE